MASTITSTTVEKNFALTLLTSKIRESLAARGTTTLRGIARSFRIVDWDGNNKLGKKEFVECMNNAGVFLTTQEVSLVFNNFDSDGSGLISAEEFLAGLKGEMNGRRARIVAKVYDRLDRDGSGAITKSDLVGRFNASKHPDVLAGKKTRDQVFDDFLKTFEGVGSEESKDARITEDEFFDYYNEISATIESDSYFITMIENAYMVTETDTTADDVAIERLSRMLKKKVAERTHRTESDKARLERAFRGFDKDGTGNLTIDEFAAACEALGIPVERRLVSSIFDRFDKDKSGFVDYHEFSGFCFGDEERKLMSETSYNSSHTSCRV